MCQAAFVLNLNEGKSFDLGADGMNHRSTTAGCGDARGPLARREAAARACGRALAAGAGQGVGPRRRHRGFTVVEVMVVIAMIAIATAVAIPDLSTWVVNARIEDAAGTFQENLQWARAYALKTDQEIDMNVTALGAGGCGWSMNVASQSAPGKAVVEGAAVQGAPVMVTTVFAKRYSGVSCSAGAGATFPLTFLPNGMVLAPPPGGGPPTITNEYLSFAATSDTAKFTTWLVKYYGAGELRSCIMAPLSAQNPVPACANA